MENIINTNVESNVEVNAFTISQVNKMLKDGINSGEKQYTQLKWNKFEKKFVTRNFFTADYLKKFKAVSNYLEEKCCGYDTVTVTNFFVEAANEQYTTEILRWGMNYSVEEYEQFVKQKLRWGVTIRFPKKDFNSCHHLQDINYYFVYSYFENGEGGYDHAFIEYSSVEDTFYGEFYEAFFHRAYVSLNGQTYPFFKYPTCHSVSKLYGFDLRTSYSICHGVSKSRDYNIRDEVEFSVITYLNHDLGMFAHIADRGHATYYKEEPLSNKSVEYYDADYHLKKEYYTFTLAEARQLNPRWKEDEEDGDY